MPDAPEVIEPSPARYVHIRAYALRGISLPAAQSAVALLERGRLSARLAIDEDPSLAELDRRVAVANMMLDGAFRGASGDFSDRLLKAVADARAYRRNKHGLGPYLILEWHGEVAQLSPSPKVDTRDFVVGFSSDTDSRPEAVPDNHVNAILAALALTSPKLFAAQLASEGFVYFQKSERPIYSYRPQASGAAYVSSPVEVEALSAVPVWFDRVLAAESLERVVRLIVASFHTEGDNLRSFLSSWTALEILVQKLFADAEREFFRPLQSSDRPLAQRSYIGRIREVMKAKYRLTDKFALLALQLAPTECDADIASFSAAKAQRDDLLHGQDVDERILQVRQTQDIVRKYLRLHWDRPASS